MKWICTGLLVLMVAGAVALAAPPRPLEGPVRDLRKEIDFERIGEFHLGPTGALGWMHVSADFMTGEARQILITTVEPGSPAEGVLQPGDVILGAGGGPFATDARKALGRAIDEAEQEGALKLLRWRPKEGTAAREGHEETVVLELKAIGSYTDTAPYRCPKSERILEAAVARLLARESWGKFGDKALALLATGDPKHLPAVRDYIHAAKWAKPDLEIGLEKGGLVCWGYGYHNLLLTEYFLATGDKYVLPAIREYSVKIAMGQSSAGTWGHGFAWKSKNDGRIHGRLGGYGALNQAGLPCFLSMILARRCGIEHPEVDAAIERSTTFFRSFVGHGSIGYGFHRPSLEIRANGRNGMSGNGKNGVAAVAFRLLGDDASARFFARLTASLYNTCEYGHSGNSYSYFWDPLGAHVGGPATAAAFLRELRWYHTLTRKPDGSFVYQPLGGIYGKGLLDATASQVLLATLPRRALFLTGKEMDEDTWCNEAEVAETIAAGRWRLADPGDTGAEELIAQLDSWSPIAREWIAKALATKDGDFTPRLRKMLAEGSTPARAGACAALGHQGDKAAAGVADLARALRDDPVVAIPASYALARIEGPAAKALPELLEAMRTRDEVGLMRPIQQAMSFAFGYDMGRVAPLYFSGLLPTLAREGDPLAGLDRDLLHPVVAKLLQDPSGRTRGCAAYAFTHFSREDLAAMADEVHAAVTKPAPHYRMFSDDARQHALSLMLKHRIAEGIPLCLATMDLDQWGRSMRLPHRFALLKGYAGSARPFLPEVRDLLGNFKEGPDHDALSGAIAAIEEDDDPAPLVSLHTLVDEQLARDLAIMEDKAARVAACRALFVQNPDRPFYQAACLRALVAFVGEDARPEVQAALKSDSGILRTAAEGLATAVSLPLNPD